MFFMRDALQARLNCISADLDNSGMIINIYFDGHGRLANFITLMVMQEYIAIWGNTTAQAVAQYTSNAAAPTPWEVDNSFKFNGTWFERNLYSESDVNIALRELLKLFADRNRLRPA